MMRALVGWWRRLFEALEEPDALAIKRPDGSVVRFVRRRRYAGRRTDR